MGKYYERKRVTMPRSKRGLIMAINKARFEDIAWEHRRSKDKQITELQAMVMEVDLGHVMPGHEHTMDDLRQLWRNLYEIPRE
jgi:hypothetical protein